MGFDDLGKHEQRVKVLYHTSLTPHGGSSELQNGLQYVQDTIRSPLHGFTLSSVQNPVSLCLHGLLAATSMIVCAETAAPSRRFQLALCSSRLQCEAARMRSGPWKVVS